MAKLTIALVAYNEEKYLAETLQSLLDQTYADFVLTAYDNGSEDNTLAIMRRFASIDHRIKVVHEKENDPRCGLKTAHRCDTEYFMFAAGHDLYHPTFVEKCVAQLEADPGVVLAYSKSNYFKDEEQLGFIPAIFETRGMEDPMARALVVALGLIHNYQFYGIYRATVLKQVLRKFIKYNIVGYDHLFQAELAMFGTFALVDETLFMMRQCEDFGDPVAYRKKHLPHESDGLEPFLRLLNAYKEDIAQWVPDSVEKEFFKLALFCSCFLRYRNLLGMFGESVQTMFARPGMQRLWRHVTNLGRVIEEELAAGVLPRTDTNTGESAVMTGMEKVGEALQSEDISDRTDKSWQSEWARRLRDLIHIVRPSSIIETGGCRESETTRIIAEALKDEGFRNTTFISLFVHPDDYYGIIDTLKERGLMSWVRPLHGLALPRQRLQQACPQSKKSGYDVNGVENGISNGKLAGLPDDLLGFCLRRFNFGPDIVIIGHADRTGLLEFRYLTEKLAKPCHVVFAGFDPLHYQRLCEDLGNDPRSSIIYGADGKSCFLIIKYDPDVGTQAEKIQVAK